MGYAVLNLSKQYVKRMAPGYFRVVRATELAAYENDDRVAIVEVPENRCVGPRPLRGRYTKLFELVGNQPAVIQEPVPEPDPEPDPAEETETPKD